MKLKPLDPKELEGESNKNLLITVVADVRHLRIETSELKQEVNAINGRVRGHESTIAVVKNTMERCPMNDPDISTKVLSLAHESKSTNGALVAGLSKRELVPLLMTVIMALVAAIGWLANIRILDTLQ